MAMEESATAVAGSDLSQALAFVMDAFDKWHGQGLIGGAEHERIRAYYQDLKLTEPSGKPLSGALMLSSPDVCWSCKGPTVGAQVCCPECGAPVRSEAVDRLRYLICLCHEIKFHERAGRLELSAAHGCLAEANGRVAALRRKLDGQRIPSVLPVHKAPMAFAAPPSAAHEPSAPIDPPPPAAPRRNVLEIILDPRSLQWLLACGAGVLVIGLIIWLAESDWFKNNVFVALLLGVGNALLLAGGWSVIRFTRYQLAGRAITLLACLLMPLNLWFYNTHDLMTVTDGHLWIAALVCCVLYAVSASLLRDRAFVYVFVGGVALTGLLMLADARLLHGDFFWQISPPATFLVCLGLACIHVERAFPEGEGPFSRRRFGLAFFWSGHAALAAGLLVILGAQLTGDLFQVIFKHLFEGPIFGLTLQQPSGILEANGRLLALALIAAATYAYAYSDLVVRRVGVYIHLAVVCFLWAELSLLRWMDGPPESFIAALALTGLLANFALTALLPPTSALRRTGPSLALGLCGLPLILGLALHIRAVAPFVDPYRPGWWYVAAMALTAVACRVGAYMHRADRPWLVWTYLFGSAGAVLLGAAGLLMTLNPGMEWRQQAPILMLIPLAYLIAARLYRGKPLETPVVWAAHVGTAVLIVSCLGAAFQGFVLQRDPALNLLLATFFAEAALFYLLAAVWRDREFAVYACAVTAAAAVWQLLVYAGVSADEYYVGAFAVLGLLLLVAYRFTSLEKAVTAGLGRAAFQAGNALLSLAAVAGALLALSNLNGRERFDFALFIGLQAVLAAACVAALFLVRQQGWRRWYLLAAIVEGGLTALVVFQNMGLSDWQKLELVCLAVGLGLLTAGHVGWRQERERENDLVSFGLFLGSLFVAVPLTYAVLYYRFRTDDFGTWRTLNEVGMLAAGMLLLGSGILLHIKSTTITGTVVMALYLLSLVAFLRLPNMMTMAAMYLMIGGGLFFGVGLLLSVYRDRLLALPQRIKRREGLFRVLNWR